MNWKWRNKTQFNISRSVSSCLRICLSQNSLSFQLKLFIFTKRMIMCICFYFLAHLKFSQRGNKRFIYRPGYNCNAFTKLPLNFSLVEAAI